MSACPAISFTTAAMSVLRSRKRSRACALTRTLVKVVTGELGWLVQRVASR
jgi:hypothetical protein